MSTWNYRVARTTQTVNGEEYVSFAIHEAHYDKPESAPRVISRDAMTTSFESVEELRAGLTRMLASLDKPVLNYEDF
jgi:hypothetical protein